MDRSIRNRIGKFIDIPADVMTIEHVLQLKSSNIKGLDKKSAGILNKVLGISKIIDLTKKSISKDNVTLLGALGIKPNELSNWVLISKMLHERKFDAFSGICKISIFGLNNAGKTTFLNMLQGNLNLNVLLNSKPTVGADQIFINIVDTKYVIWDMGGQERYREEYIKNAEKYFLAIDLLIFVIDIQDPPNFNDALIYLKDIININESLKENPEFLIMLHKADPVIRNRLEVKTHVQELTDQINEIFKDKDFKMGITTSSIYNWLKDNRSVAKEISDFIKISQNEELQTIEYLRNSVKQIMNYLIYLNSKIDDRFTQIENSMGDLAEWVKSVRPTTANELVEYEFDDTKLKIMGFHNELKRLLTDHKPTIQEELEDAQQWAMNIIKKVDDEELAEKKS